MPNNELDYQVLLGTYQRKSADLLAQVIALEARVSSNNNTIDALNKQVNDLLKELEHAKEVVVQLKSCLLYTSPSPRDGLLSRMPSSA